MLEKQLGIKPLENKYPKSLSGGEKTRAAVICERKIYLR